MRELTKDRDVLCVPEQAMSCRRRVGCHAAGWLVVGGERSAICVGQTRSIICIAPPQCGQAQNDCLVVRDEGGGFGAACSKRKHRGSKCERWRLARKPKLRMRTKPGGNRCSRKRRRNSWAESSMMRLRLP